MTTLVRRPAHPASAALQAAGLPPVLARVYAARGIASAAELDHSLSALPSYAKLRGIDAASERLVRAIARRERILIVADYDADGATAAAVGVLALRRFGATVESLVPNRFEFGYGLTPEIVRVAAERRPDFIVTVDNGIASLEGVDEARRLGIEVLVTDHHLPGPELPAARVIVNPNQPGCGFPSKHLAGVGVMFYAMLALRAELRRRGAFASAPEPNLADYLDLVALGTVADVVPLDQNNRILVAQGLARMRAGRTRPGIAALAEAAGRTLDRATAQDLGFLLGPRLNAAGRLEDMAVGVECLVTADPGQARELAHRLDSLNRERREIEADMQAQALAAVDQVDGAGGHSLVLHDAGWHQGIVGLLASRLREKFHRPTFCFAPGGPGELKGSGRSIAGLHLRDALDRVDRRCPGLLLRFGGHAAAAGASLRPDGIDAFRTAFEAVAAELLTPADLEEVIETDGPLAPGEFDLGLAEALRDEVWGQGFPPPTFSGEFQVCSQRVVGGHHLKLELRPGDAAPRTPPLAGILFRRAEPLPGRIRAVYRLDVNEWNGSRSLQLVVSHWEPA